MIFSEIVERKIEFYKKNINGPLYKQVEFIVFIDTHVIYIPSE